MAVAARPGTLTVAAALDLHFAFAEIGALFEEQTGVEVTFTFGASGNLAGQIENGAPVDLFAAADTSYVDRLIEAGALLPETRRVYALGHLVLASSIRAGAEADELTDLLDPAIVHVAIANPGHAPYGRAAREALETRRAVGGPATEARAGRERAAGPAVHRNRQRRGGTGAALAGRCSRYQLRGRGSVALHAAGAGPGGRSPNEADARRFAELVTGPEGRAVLERYGFGLPPE